MGWEGDLGGGGVTQLVRELGGFELSQPLWGLYQG